MPPFQEGEDSLFFETFNRGKKSISLDLRHPDAKDVLHDLVRVCDAVYSNLRGDQPRKLGLTYDQLRHVNPAIVCCSLSGFGMSGPRASEGGYDYMMQGLAGWQSLTGEPGGPPTKSGLSLVDLSGGYASAIAVLAGIWRARRDGVGCDCDVSLFETALHELMYIGPWAATHGYVPPRRASSAHPTIVPFQNFEASDGWFVVAAAKQSFWERTCAVIGRPDLSEDERFATMAGRNANRDELVPVLEDAFRARPAQEWIDALVAAGVPASRVNTVEEALVDPQTVAREDIVEYEHPSLGTVRSIRTPLRLASGGERLEREPERSPHRGEHTAPSSRASAGTRPSGWRARQGGCLRDTGVTARDLVGYGATPPDPRWPDGARVALSFVLNYEEGGENTPLEGDPASEAFLHEVVGAPPTEGRRNLNTESMFEFGSRAGFWRVHRIFTAHGLPLTVFAVGQALERNPAAARAMIDAGWEVASHGWRWIDYGEMPEDEERAHMRRSIEAIERVCGVRPVGWYTGRGSEATRTARRRGGWLSLRLRRVRGRAPLLDGRRRARAPRHPVLARRERLQVPAPERVRHGRRLRGVPDRLARAAASRGRPDAVGRVALPHRRPAGACPGLARFIEHVRACDDVWVATRADIARHWQTTHPPPPRR